MRSEFPNVPFYTWNEFLTLSADVRKEYIKTLMDTFNVPLILIECLMLNVPEKSLGAARRLWQKYGFSLEDFPEGSFFNGYFDLSFFRWIEQEKIKRSIPRVNYQIELQSKIVCTWENAEAIDTLLLFFNNACQKDFGYCDKRGCIIDGKRYREYSYGDDERYTEEDMAIALPEWERKTHRDPKDSPYDVRRYLDLHCFYSPEKMLMLLAFINYRLVPGKSFYGDTQEITRRRFHVIDK